MSLLLIIVLITCAIYLYLFVKNGVKLDSAFNVVIVVWFYYALSTPIDILLGADISYKSNRLLLQDISLECLRPYVTHALIFYICFIISFYISYQIVPERGKHIPYYKKYEIPIIPIWLLLIINICVALAFLPYSLTMSETERYLYAYESTTYKLLSTLLTFSQALFILYLLQTNDRRKAFFAMLYTMVPAFVKGGRLHIFIPLLLYIIRYRLYLGRVKAISIGICALLFIAYWKLIYYGIIIPMYIDRSFEQIVYNVFPEINLSFSSLEGLDAYIIFVNLLAQEGFDYLLGSTYIITPLQITLPRFLTGISTKTLSEEFTLTFDPEHAAVGGGMAFNGIAEAWMNFGTAGPIILGLVWGLAAKYLDSGKRGASFFVFVIISCMLFRTEFASLYKGWIVMLGGNLFAIIVITKLFILFSKSLTDKTKISLDRGNQ